mgnify:CR=1 FL=1
MVAFSISSIFQRFRKSSQSELYQTGAIVKFPRDEGKVYAMVVSLEGFLREKPKWYNYTPSQKAIDSGEDVCLLLADGLYTVMPGSALGQVNLNKELKLLEQSRSKLEIDYEQKPSKSAEMLLHGLDMNISFLEKAISSYQN